MWKIILNLFIVFVIPSICAQNLMCQKVDFNRPTSVVSEFGECPGESLNVLKINSYAATTITPFRPASEFHLSATVQGLSCLQSTSIFTLNVNSEIRTAIFLKWVDIGAWIKVQLIDKDGEQIDVMAQLEESDIWLGFYGKVNRSIENALIEIWTNMNPNSDMAMEYFHVLNSDVQSDDCVDEDTEPPVTTEEPTDEPTDETTDEPQQPTEPTDEQTNEITDFPTDETDGFETTETFTITTTTPAAETESKAVYLWMSLTILFIVTTLTTLAGIYYFIWLYRRLQYVTAANVVGMTSTLPRLQVKNSVNDGDHVIVGIDKF